MIKISNLCKNYQVGSNLVPVLKNINLNIKKGDMVAIIGDSGSGKSTLMNIIGCLDTQNSGKYFLDGIQIKKLSDKQLCNIRNQKIGFVFQSFNLLPELTAFENVELSLIYQGIAKNLRKTIVQNALEEMGLNERASHLPNQLSGGQMQRVAIARAIVTNPEIILADEPTGNLDSKASKKILHILNELNNQGKTVVIITHSSEVANAAKTVIKINDGELVTLT